MSCYKELVFISLTPDVTRSSEVSIDLELDYWLEWLYTNVKSAQAQIFACFYKN